MQANHNDIASIFPFRSVVANKPKIQFCKLITTDIPTKPSGSKHYAVYNDSLIAKPILAGCPENGVIYDPFMGSGSTAEAALRANRKYIGSEMSTEYLDISNKRLEPFLKQYNLF